MAKITIKDVADRLQISPATVSLALNNRPGVNKTTREKVLAAVKELNYQGGTGGNKSYKNDEAAQGNIGFLIYKRYGKIVTNSQFFIC